ncbi:MFS transporter [Planosporangium mesophilum]|uniref:Sugar efflux transporter SetB n=1 Tax=Planosporangium mesophilum TaxID=689768 RepID=A0A8J3TDY5_9ACTN|nr:MFS transporter [Planosporangium mesophilum]NJC85906.1 MFS transporter [Planosporangium mesophilum]GII25043.1 sugar efflux transporter SetB [Planosporangium mesophilum]
MTSGTGSTSGTRLPQLLVSVLLLGIADSMIGPYLVLFGVDEAHLSPLQVGVFMSLVAASGLVVSTWLGRHYDRSASRGPAFIALAAPAVGYLALTTTTGYALLLLIAVGLLGAGLAAFPQLFALARTHLDGSAGSAARRGTPVLRSVWSLAWATGPMIGAAVLARQGYRGLLIVTAAAFALVALPLLLLPAATAPPRRTAVSRTGTRMTRPILLAATAFTLFHTAMISGSVALPLYVTRTLDRADSDVGLLFSVCALVEVPAALSLVLLPARVRKQRVILLGMLVFVTYFLLVAVSSTMPLLIGTQVARGTAIAVVGALGITYMQDLIPGATGRATTLFANTLTIGSLISGVVAGAAAQALGYRATLLLCGVLSAVGCVLLASARQLRSAGSESSVSPAPGGAGTGEESSGCASVSA